MKSADSHDAADIVERRERIEPLAGICLKVIQSVSGFASQIAKLVARKLHQFIDRPGLHFFLHRLAAPIAAFGEALATEEADAPRSGRNAVDEC